MVKRIQSIRGMKDYLPKEIVLWQYIEHLLKKVLVSYGYSEIRLPILEHTLLFKRAIGEVTDIVEKEMYSFKDYNGDDLTLRPEGTAGCIRAGIEHSLLNRNVEQRWWYIGPMFRHERPQKGRYRQFYQLGAEVFGLYGPDIDAELIMLTARWWKILGISEYVTLELNSIGSLKARNHYCTALVKFLVQHEMYLDDICRRIMYTNPMRILDTKNPNIQILLNDAPVILDYLDDDAHTHFSSLCKLLDFTGIKYRINPRLVRGLDYYNYTVFEWITKFLGSQGTICAGGRYDLLVEQLGGNATPAIGAAIGLDRLVLLIQTVIPSFLPIISQVDIYLVAVGNNTQGAAILLAEKIRDALPLLRIVINHGGGNFKKQFSRANKHDASFALIIGEHEIAAQQVTVKNLLTSKQETILQKDIIKYLSSMLVKKIN